MKAVAQHDSREWWSKQINYQAYYLTAKPPTITFFTNTLLRSVCAASLVRDSIDVVVQEYPNMNFWFFLFFRLPQNF